MRGFGVVPMIAALFFLSAPAIAEEKPNCHSYDAADPNPKVQREFGALFRQGYEVATICGAVVGPLEYFIGYRPVKAPTGVCLYRQRALDRELALDQRLSDDYDHAEMSYRWFGDGPCPPPADARYYLADGVPDEAFTAMMDFWNLARKRDDFARLFSRIPAGSEKIKFLNFLREAVDSGKAKLEDVHLDNQRHIGIAGASDRQDIFYSVTISYYGYSYPITSPSMGWSIQGKVKNGEFVPVAVGEIQY